jgi:hypothetical protein
MNPKIKILVATHKPISEVENDIFIPIQVGKAINDFVIKDSYFLDNTQDSISNKNKTFNELTALYWAWKNMSDYNFIGLAHYRRFLDIHYKKPFFKKENKQILTNVVKESSKLQRLNDVNETTDKIIGYLDSYDILVAKPAFCSINNEPTSIAADYKHNHIASDWDTCISILTTKFPEYTKSVDLYLNTNNKFYIANMFISKKELFTNYCEWLFEILFELEKQIVVSTDSYQARVFGFLSERLFTLYILHNNFKLKELPILFVE